MHYELRVIGNPILHSKSPLIHAEFAKQFKLSVNYERVLAPLDGFAATVSSLQKSGVVGANVTLPFKEQAYQLAKFHSESAKRAKAANTLCFKPEGIFADNTDGIGLVNDVENHIGYRLKGKRILILGAGGAVRGILYPIIKAQPSTISIANRSVDKAVHLTSEFSDAFPLTALPYSALQNQTFDVIIDGTSFSHDPLPLSETLSFSGHSLAYDLKYGQVSWFLDWAKKHKASLVHDGMGMLLEQAAAAFQLWTGLKPNTDQVRSKFTFAAR